MVNNPPGFTYQTDLQSIVIPYGSAADLLRAADQFEATWLILDANRPEHWPPSMLNQIPSRS